MTLDEWLEYGYDNMFCSRPACATHNGFPKTIIEDQLLDEGNDPCIEAVRLYEDVQTRNECENKHKPIEMINKKVGPPQPSE